MKKRFIIIFMLITLTGQLFASTLWFGKENFANKLTNKNDLLFILKGTLEPSYGALGLLDYTNRKNVYPDGIICQGTGILFSLLYASGYEVDQIVNIIEKAPLDTLVNSRIPINQTILDMHQVVRYFKEYIPYETIDELPIAFAYLALDLVENDIVTISEGRIIDALNSAFSYPLVGNPTIYKGRFLVDGATIDIKDYIDLSNNIILFDAFNDDKDKNLYDPLVTFVRFNYRKPLNTDKVLSISYAGKAKQISYLNVRNQYLSGLKLVKSIDRKNNYISLVASNYDKRTKRELNYANYTNNQNYSESLENVLSVRTKDFSRSRYLDPNLGLGLSYTGYYKDIKFSVDGLIGYQSQISYIPTGYANLSFSYLPVDSVIFEVNNSYNFSNSIVPNIFANVVNNGNFEAIDNELYIGYDINLEHLYSNKVFNLLYIPSLTLNWNKCLFNLFTLDLKNRVGVEIGNMFKDYHLYVSSQVDFMWNFGLYTNLGLWSRVGLTTDNTNLYIKDGYKTNKFNSYNIGINSKFLIGTNIELGYKLPQNIILGETIQFTDFIIGGYSHVLFDSTGFYGVSAGGTLGFSTTVFGVSKRNYKLEVGYDTAVKALSVAFSF